MKKLIMKVRKQIAWCYWERQYVEKNDDDLEERTQGE